MGETELAVSVFERIGGEAAVQATVEAFYERVLADPILVPFFIDVDMPTLKQQQVDFFSQALGGSETYRGPDMKTAHAHMAIEQQHFNRVTQHLVDTLQFLGVQQEHVDTIVQTIGPLATEIVNTMKDRQPETTSIQNSKKKRKESRMGQNVSQSRGGASTVDLGEETTRTAEGARMKSMMENMPINVIYADRDLVIQYVNPASVKTLKTLEQFLPCKVNDLVGSCIDIFHKNPAHQRKLLGDPKNLPYQATIEVGPEKLDLLVNAIYDEQGSYTGPMVTWEVVTKKLETEANMARVMSMMDNAPINVMFVDRDLILKYMNPASLNKLKTLEHILPIKVDQMLGSCVDVFHKNPKHQRQILSDPKNLPYRANIELGEETLDLLVSAIFDNENTYIGAMATWEVITDKLEKERLIKEAADREKEQQEKLKQGVEEIAQIGSTLASASEELTSVSNTMGSTAEETSSQANVVAAAAEEVSKNVQSVSTGSEEMTASIQEIAKNTTDAAKVASQAVSVAETTNETVGKLGQSSAEIGSIIKVINSIAQQTNLLALNATIEAARAGEAGKGFAVVANEVKELAKETTKATENISRMIETIQSDTKGSVDAIAQISTIIKQVNDYMNTIASAVEEQTVTTNEMARNVSEASKGSMEIAGNIVSVADAARSTTEGATQTQQASSELSRMASDLQKVVAQLT